MAGQSVLRAGSCVLYVDEKGFARPALVTAVWREPGAADEPTAAVNLVIVSPDEKRIDPYGRAVERRASVPHQKHARTPFGHWRSVEEEARKFEVSLTHH